MTDSWGTYPMPLDSIPQATSPARRSTRLRMPRRMVVLPEPLSPLSRTISPEETVKLTGSAGVNQPPARR